MLKKVITSITNNEPQQFILAEEMVPLQRLSQQHENHRNEHHIYQDASTTTKIHLFEIICKNM